VETIPLAVIENSVVVSLAGSVTLFDQMTPGVSDGNQPSHELQRSALANVPVISHPSTVSATEYVPPATRNPWRNRHQNACHTSCDQRRW
jgi:hypothetical protein